MEELEEVIMILENIYPRIIDAIDISVTIRKLTDLECKLFTEYMLKFDTIVSINHVDNGSILSFSIKKNAANAPNNMSDTDNTEFLLNHFRIVNGHY